MLQYPVQQQPFSHFQFKDIRRPNDIHPITLPKSSSTRSSTIRPLFAPSPIDIPRNLPSDSSISSASPPTPSTKLPLPRSPYISSRQILPSPIPTGTGTTPLPVERPTSGASSIASSTIEDVFYPGDIVGEDALLQGEPIRLVSIGSTSQSCAADYVEPAKEFEVVRRLGTGSYAVVYLVREVLSRSPSSDDGHGHISLLGSMEMDGPISQQGTEYGREFAIKCLSKANLDDDALAAQMSEVSASTLKKLLFLGQSGSGLIAVMFVHRSPSTSRCRLIPTLSPFTAPLRRLHSFSSSWNSFLARTFFTFWNRLAITTSQTTLLTPPTLLPALRPRPASCPRSILPSSSPAPDCALSLPCLPKCAMLLPPVMRSKYSIVISSPRILSSLTGIQCSRTEGLSVRLL